MKGVFNSKTSGPLPQNTGVHNLDTDYDRVIGKSAQQGWAVVEKRNQDKRRLLDENPEKVGKDLSRNEDGSYRFLKPEERAIHERANKLAMEPIGKRKQS